MAEEDKQIKAEESEEDDDVVADVAGGGEGEAAKKKKKKKNKKKKAGGGGGAAAEEGGAAAEPDYSYQNEYVAEKDHHIFWDTQPVRSFTEEGLSAEQVGPIEPVDKEVSQEPLKLPEGFSWATIDVNDDSQMQDIFNHLAENYVEDDENLFRFNYSVDFLKWALTPPGYHSDWHIAVKYKNGSIAGFITGIPVQLLVHGKTLTCAEINFLCVHKKWRSKRLAPVLIREVTRRVNVRGIFQAVYTAGVVLPRPVASARYWHRSLNPKKLIDVGFSRLAPRMTMKMTLKLYALPDKPVLPNLRPMVATDVASCASLLRKYLQKFSLYQHFSDAEFGHMLLPRDGVISSFVLTETDKPNSKVTDFFSFYALPSTVIGNREHPILRAAYAYYMVPTKYTPTQLMQDALTIARAQGFDVFNCLDILENEPFLRELKFGVGDGHLQYYLYNWRCPDMPPGKVGLVLV